MKKYYYILALATACLAACSSDNDELNNEIVNNEPIQPVVSYIHANANENATTRGSVDNDAKFSWNTGDKIAVYTTDGYKISNGLESTFNATNAATFGFSDMTDANRTDFAIYPASLVWDGTNILANSVTNHDANNLTLTLPASYTLADVQDEVSPTPMIATNTAGGELSFKSLCALLRITVQNIPAATRRLEFDFNGNKVQGEFTLTGVTPGTTGITTSATTGTDDIITVYTPDIAAFTESLVINLPVPAGVASTGEYTAISIIAYDAASAGNKLMATIRPIKKTENWVPGRKASRKMSAALQGLFTIASGKKAIISPGNLQYTTSGTHKVKDGGTKKGTWRFAEHQWDFVGGTYNSTSYGNVYVGSVKSNNSNISSTYTGWIDLFNYGTSGDSYNPYDPTADYNYTNISGVSDDWGFYNAIDGFAPNTWRTPTESELDYLLFNRSGNSYTKATLTDVDIRGLILLPDGYSHPDDITSLNSINSTDASFTSNKFTTDQWAKMEAAGAVFLPAAGTRNSSKTYSDGGCGDYWTSKPKSGDYKRSLRFYYIKNNGLGGDEYYINWSSSGGTYGNSVRLIRNM